MGDKYVDISENPSGLKRSMGEFNNNDGNQNSNNANDNANDNVNNNSDSQANTTNENVNDNQSKNDDYEKLLTEFDKTIIDGIPEDELKKIVASNKEDVIKEVFLTKKQLKELENQIKEKENEIKKYSSSKEFFDGLKKDFVGTYKRFQKEYDLPDIDYIKNQVSSGGDVSSSLAQWQKEVLVKEVSEKFNLSPEEFVYDPSEAYTAGTPSYEYRIRTEQKERELLNEYENIRQRELDALNKITEQRNKDLIELRKKYFPDDDYSSSEEADKEFVNYLQKLDEMYEKMQKGDFSPKSNPFSLFNIFRGVMFDELVKKQVEKAVNEVHEQYHKHSLYLPDDKQTPTDATNVKGEEPKSKDVNETKKKFSPLYRTLKV